MKNWLDWLRNWRGQASHPAHLKTGVAGEKAAAAELQRLGLQLLVSNYRSDSGEIDLVCRDQDCMAFVEVKTRSSEDWTRPATAVDRKKQRRICLCAMDYLRELGNPDVRFRFDIVEVLMDGRQAREIRHVPNAFPLAPGLRYR